MGEIKLTTENAWSAYRAATPETQETLAKLFEGQVNFVKSWKDARTFEDLCQITGDNPNDPRFNSPDEDDNINRRMKVLVRAYNGAWKPQWSNLSQPKYFIWWEYSGAGFRFDGVGGVIRSYSNVGSRLAFESKEKAKHAAANFAPLFNTYLNCQ